MSREVVECPKCHGAGRIEAFYHVLSGVCFCCKGQKTIVLDIEAAKSSLSESCRIKAKWVMRSTEASYANLSFAKLSAIRDFVHGGWALREAYPELRSHYFAVGEWAFQAAQEEMLANLVI
jgi:hypothetical protein